MDWADDESFPWRDRLRLVPYRGINKGSQFMLALKPDEVCVVRDGQKVVTTKVLIGLDGGQLSSEKTYRAIIHPVLMEGMEEGTGLSPSGMAAAPFADNQEGASISTPGS
ncbi:Sporulation factor SpoIIGA [compost metagenome]